MTAPQASGGGNPWADMAVLPTAEEQEGLSPVFRIPWWPIWATVFVGVNQLLLWKWVSPSAFASGEAVFYDFVSSAAIQISILVLTLTPAMAAIVLSVTTREERGQAYLSRPSETRRGIWRLFSPMLPATVTIFFVFLFGRFQADFENATLSGLLATALFGLIFLQVLVVLHVVTAVRSQVLGEGKYAAATLLKRLEEEGRIKILEME